MPKLPANSNDTPSQTETLTEGERDTPEGPLAPARDIAKTLRHIHSRFLWGLLLTYCLGAGVAVGALFVNPVRDWALFLAMYLVILAYIIAYIKAHQRRRRVLRVLGLAITEALIGFWIFILVDRIPARQVFENGNVQLRGELSLLWFSVACLALSGVGLVVHWAWVGRLHENAQTAALEAEQAANG